MATPTEFMSRVVPWPGPGENGFVNIHWRLRDKDNPQKLFWSGQPFNSITDFMSKVQWGVASPSIVSDIFFCLSQQSKHGGFKNGKAKVLRDAGNATKLRALWLDVDVKAPPKGYGSLQEAVRAVYVFAQAIGMPDPTALVASGGGVHVYWISDRDLTLEEWRPYAEGLWAKAKEHGLRADPVTTDAARILRVPGTFNCKEAIPREVRLLKLDAADIDFEKTLAHIAVNVPVTAAVTKPALLDLSGITVSDGFKAAMDPAESLSDGIDSVKEILLNWGLVEEGCAFMREAKATGGKDHSEPLWSLTLLAASFFAEGETLAHELSNQHPGYSPADTDKKYQQKLAQRKKGDLGFPQCSKFEGEGSTKCAGCPFRGKIKSPLNLGIVHPTPAPHINASASPASQALLLPDDGVYFVDDDGYICQWVTVPGKKGEPPIDTPIRLFNSLFKNPRSHGSPNRALSFDCQTDLETWERVRLAGEERSTLTELCRSMDRQGVMWNTKAEPLLRGFFMAWLTKLNKTIAATKNRPFGWVFKNGKRDGFSFGGITYKIDGTTEMSSLPEGAIKSMYEPMGEKQAWLDALDLVIKQKRPHLDVLVLSAFATPILWATGGTGGTFGAWGKSGTNKTSAVMVALAVWGDPLSTKMKPNSTANSIEERLGNIDCLPLIVDDAQKTSEFTQVCEMVFDVTSGVNKSRLRQNATTRDPKKSKSSMIVTANNSYYDFMINTMKVNTNASLARVLEMEVAKPEGAQGRVSQTDADKILGALEHNHGVIGVEYVKYLVGNLDYVAQYCDNLAKSIETKFKMREEERFWKSFVAGVLAAAHFVDKALGIKFDTQAIYDLLAKTYMDCRRRIEMANVEGHTQTAVEGILAAFVHRYYGNQLWTDRVPMGRGKPAECKALKTPNDNSARSVIVHWIVEDRVVRISKQAFFDFLNEKNASVSSVMEGLEKHFGMELKKVRLGAGINTWSMPQEWVLSIPIGMHHSLEPDLFKHCPVEEIPDHVKRASAGPDVTATVIEKPLVIDTGIVPASALKQVQADLNKVMKQ